MDTIKSNDTTKDLDLAKVREALKAQRARLRTGLRAGEATCGNYNR